MHLAVNILKHMLRRSGYAWDFQYAEVPEFASSIDVQLYDVMKTYIDLLPIHRWNPINYDNTTVDQVWALVIHWFNIGRATTNIINKRSLKRIIFDISWAARMAFYFKVAPGHNHVLHRISAHLARNFANFEGPGDGHNWRWIALKRRLQSLVERRQLMDFQRFVFDGGFPLDQQ